MMDFSPSYQLNSYQLKSHFSLPNVIIYFKSHLCLWCGQQPHTNLPLPRTKTTGLPMWISSSVACFVLYSRLLNLVLPCSWHCSFICAPLQPPVAFMDIIFTHWKTVQVPRSGRVQLSLYHWKKRGKWTDAVSILLGCNCGANAVWNYPYYAQSVPST